MRRVSAAALFALLLALSLHAATLPELFQKAKEQFKLGNYKESLAAVEALDAESAKLGLEAERARLLPGLLFYKGADLAALGRPDEAEQAFEAFLASQPNATIDPALYPPKVYAAFEKARQSSAPAPRTQPEQTGVIATVYRAFRPPDTKPAEEAGEDWAAVPPGGS